MRLPAYAIQIKTHAQMQLFSRFFLADVCFTFLPLAIIAVLRRSLGKFDPTFYTDPEWSFAAIIIFGLAMTRVLELKVKYQGDRSERVFALMRMCILGLIAAVISLALTQMNTGGLKVSAKCMQTLQFSVLAFGLFLLYLAHWGREYYLHQRNHLPTGMGLPRFYRFIMADLEELRNDADELCLRMSRRAEFTYTDPQQKADCANVIRRHDRDAEHLLAEVAECLDRLRAVRNTWKDADETVQQQGGGYSPSAPLPATPTP